ncbi:slr0699 [Synechocystis sp. PCC 6803]|uniref:Slr0699 protein n=1 Tax=Synechocystis sp. (strain ATCC 27184 / PCC 6803 / Kazusa) TaxID=1111708 RepID=Q55961_SYNY3|nr:MULTISPECIES: hypothetical protein [unclassified Synechocystis]BAM53669.1 hypothetical protein BEST7613_4738 [Synechocystis sp. PCC 6803] [Bacillus subtilis BEST7613]AGF53022.1 hypothetical protein MYO_127940 [Synechocystis sp. PCC 6803]ALJ68912.1 hypothetical protein AOY38_14350 [Synechocystis sp. PCC 6803]AVP90777.1 hypothetical protein C7I86_14485 [Synechocystis sp. IPPAS B-1465]MBD2619949.1 hypothetical protein [Synechocystis sp. FACHB-898]
MFKNGYLLMGIFSATFFWLSATISAETDFNSFWQQFKTAVVNSDKSTVARLTKFPLSMPFGIESIKTETEFLQGYDDILNMEADVKRCFQTTKPKQEGKGYAIYCTFKQLPESSENRPIKYYFERTKTGWKFEGIDNINE